MKRRNDKENSPYFTAIIQTFIYNGQSIWSWISDEANNSPSLENDN